MKKIETQQQRFRRERNEAIINEYQTKYKAGTSITEWVKEIAKRKRVSYSTAYNVILKYDKDTKETEYHENLNEIARKY